MKALFFLIIGFYLCLNCYTQGTKTNHGEKRGINLSAETKTTLDSLKNVIINVEKACPEPCIADTGRINAYLECSKLFMLSNLDTALSLTLSAIELAENLIRTTLPSHVTDSAKKQLAKALLMLGIIYNDQGNITEALKYNNKSINLYEETGDQKGTADAIYNIGRIYYSQGNIPEALDYFTKSLEIFEEIGDIKGMAGSFNNKGLTCITRGDLPQAMKYLNKSFKLYGKIGDKKGIGDSFYNMAIVCVNQGDIPKALEYYNKSLIIYEKNGILKGMAYALQNIAFIYKNQGDISKALEYNNKSLKIFEEIGFERGIANTYQRIGEIYEIQGDFPKALEYSNKSLKIYEETGFEFGIAKSYQQIGKICLDQGDISKAREYYTQSLGIYEEMGNKRGIAWSLYWLGNISQKQNNISLFRKYAVKSYKIGKDHGFPDVIEKAASLMKDLSIRQGDYKKAFEYYQEEIAMRDSITNEENYKKTQKQQARYEYQKQKAVDSLAHVNALQIKELEIANIKQEKRTRAAQRNMLIVGLGLMLLVVVFIYRSLRQSRISAKHTTERLEQKLLRSQMNPHFIFNALTAIQGYIWDNDKKMAGYYLSRFAKLMRQVLESSREEYVSLKSEIDMLTTYFELQNLLHAENEIKYKIDVDPEIDIENASIPPMLAQPFIENAFKHGQFEKGTGIINMQYCLDDKKVLCNIEDNGIGIDSAGNAKKTDQEKHRSRALNITEERLANLNKWNKKKVNLEIVDLSSLNNTKKGTRVSFYAPINID